MIKNDFNLTRHFKFSELTVTSSSERLQKLNRNVANEEDIYKLALFAEQVRVFLNSPMIITSGYRCTVLNKNVGGSATSQHLKSQAIDFVPRNMTIEEAYNLLQKSPLVYGQLIIEESKGKKWIHVSMGDKKENLIYVDGKYHKIGE